MKISGLFAAGVLAAVLSGAGAAQALTLGTFNFDDSKFGNTLSQSDGGANATQRWLNVVNANPGSPGFLTGASVDTGIANIGYQNTATYTIGYTGGIANGVGADIGIVTAHYSMNDSITIAFSTDGFNFGASQVFGPGAGVATGVSRSYFYGGSSAGPVNLFVTSLDLSSFGIGAGSSILAARITGSPELDLIRVAGLAPSEVVVGGGGVPEPAAWALMLGGFGLAGAALRRRGILAA
ncbi:MAG TPA: PEPxxWA-CTERM sorting domain-containing protein, partial [Phenylobacterium sp.]|jgi:hypothetical protein